MRTARRWVALWLCLVLCIGVVADALAKDRSGHEKDYELVLFGRVLTSKERKIFHKLTIIKEALYLAIDYYNGSKSGDEALTDLTAIEIRGLPKQMKKFNYDDSSRHERQTHMGWEHKYYVNEARWAEIRKPLLLACMNYALDFDENLLYKVDVLGLMARSEASYSKQCISFSALMYYVHILGDHANNSVTTLHTRMPMGRTNYGETNPDILFELQEHLTVLFRNQKKSTDYIQLMLKLEDKATEIRSLDMNTKEAETRNQETYRAYANDVIAILADYVPKLLKNEPFFSNVFYK